MTPDAYNHYREYSLDIHRRLLYYVTKCLDFPPKLLWGGRKILLLSAVASLTLRTYRSLQGTGRYFSYPNERRSALRELKCRLMTTVVLHNVQMCGIPSTKRWNFLGYPSWPKRSPWVDCKDQPKRFACGRRDTKYSANTSARDAKPSNTRCRSTLLIKPIAVLSVATETEKWFSLRPSS